MKTRYLILLMIAGTIAMTVGLCSFIYIIAWTPSLWGVRSPLVYLGLCGVGSGWGASTFVIGAWGGILQTKNRIKKKIEQHKTLSVIRKARAM